MSIPKPLTVKQRTAIGIVFVVLLGIAFFQCFRTTFDLFWAFDVDFDRDMSYVQATLDGAYGKDPSYLHEYLWYNPLLFLIETGLVKLTGLPVNVVLVRAGAYLNLLGPICFFWMCLRLFDYKIALAALLSFLFLASGNIYLVLGATYMPWLYPFAFMLFAFFLDILLCYQAFTTQKISWFALLGLAVGITFLGHAAPAVIIVLMMISLQTSALITAIKQKQPVLVKKYIAQGLVAFLCFCLAAAPILYYVIGKYHLHIINREPSEYTEGLFFINNLWGLLKANFSFGFLIAIVGAIVFYRSFPRGLIRRIILNWWIISTSLYFYATLVAGLDHRYGIHLPAMVPAFHYFIYMKAVQSVFFGFGLVFLTQPIRKYFLPLVVLIAVAWFPLYAKREDFTQGRQKSIAKQESRDKVEVYNYILHNLDPNTVILCENDASLFPVMATGRKMVSNAYTFSNPYVDFDRRQADRITMLFCIKTGQQQPLRQLLSTYQVSYVLLSADALKEMTPEAPLPGRPVLRNNSFTLFALK
ncbi:hypothetical protein [Puia dinghuensis]|uniref:Uncharacterized protein n=1 Tax=Puia dinghuensis TaxID=1792502 RepID=A0A8J2UHZ1_9BACT|nr:hypothetical protein [Puia dinghuensis]GGB20764.1 hypothetical protein GCM10011511_50650 [Puia dinghuensis]